MGNRQREPVLTSQTIDSGELLADTEHHFRITAGPGSGKTFWLGNHVRHVTRESTRLGAASKIAVISHTNVAVRELMDRLGNAAETAEVSTIHSFLYRHVVRPYLHLIPSLLPDTPVAHESVTGHDPHIPSRLNVDNWLKSLGKGRLSTRGEKAKHKAVVKGLRSLKIGVDAQGFAEFHSYSEFFSKEVAELFSHENLLAYKRPYWESGRLSHEDVLFFADVLFTQVPELKVFLSARFPYLFIDEFQDTTPVQAKLATSMADAGSIVGVIGDPAQSIFGFVGASPDHFQQFTLPGFKDYVIVGNRRSTDKLVAVLNRVRTDGLVQTSARLETGHSPKVMTGGLDAVIQEVIRRCGDPQELLMLARRHPSVSRIRLAIGQIGEDPWELIEKADSERAAFLMNLAEAVDLGKRKLFDSAVRQLKRATSTSKKLRKPFSQESPITKSYRNAFAFSLIEIASDRHIQHRNESCLEAYIGLRETLIARFPYVKLAKPTRGNFFDAASKITFNDLLETVRTSEETRQTRTIHQAKGCQAKACFVLLEKDAIDHIVSPEPNNEEHQITYVAISRAMNHLFVYCPDASRVDDLTKRGFEPVHC